MKPIVILEDIVKKYGDVVALDYLNLELPRSQFITIIGPSGSGKTTLLNIIGGIDTPTQGRVEVAGIDISRKRPHQLVEFRKQYIGFIFQFFNLIPTLTAQENVEFVLDLVGAPMISGSGEVYRSFKRKDIRKKALAALEKVGLADRADHFPHQLSGGEQQRVSIARALVKDPPLILADEPTGNLDYRSGTKVLKVLRDLVDEEKRTVLIVTHNLEITRVSDLIVHLQAGQVLKIQENEDKVDPLSLRW